MVKAMDVTCLLRSLSPGSRDSLFQQAQEFYLSCVQEHQDGQGCLPGEEKLREYARQSIAIASVLSEEWLIATGQWFPDPTLPGESPLPEPKQKRSFWRKAPE